jgi:hypothetical protein
MRLMGAHRWARVAQSWAQLACGRALRAQFRRHCADTFAGSTRMAQVDPVLLRQMPRIEQIIRDEVWYEGERRGGPVGPDDPVVREHVCEAVLRTGAELRAQILAELACCPPAPRMLPLETSGHGRAA